MIQPKESKSNSHFWISLVKSGIRFAAGYCLIESNLIGAGILLIIAEILGIAEEVY